MTKLSVSNIAWVPTDRLAAYQLMAEAGCVGLEIAPGLFFHAADDPFEPSAAVAQAALDEIAAMGLGLVSMQSLLFGVEGAALFGGAAARARLEAGLLRAIALAERFSIPNLVFGSPQQRRIPDGMDRFRAADEAAEFFRGLGDRAAAAGTVIAMEPNPAAYGTNFLTMLDEAQSFVERVDHPAIMLNFDVGTMHMNDQFNNIGARIECVASRLSHVHVSEPELAPAPASLHQAETVMAGLKAVDYGGVVSIEMRPPAGGMAELAQCIGRLATAAANIRVRQGVL